MRRVLAFGGETDRTSAGAPAARGSILKRASGPEILPLAGRSVRCGKRHERCGSWRATRSFWSPARHAMRPPAPRASGARPVHVRPCACARRRACHRAGCWSASRRAAPPRRRWWTRPKPLGEPSCRPLDGGWCGAWSAFQKGCRSFGCSLREPPSGLAGWSWCRSVTPRSRSARAHACSPSSAGSRGGSEHCCARPPRRSAREA